jgi:CDP-diacylglycerol--serine O-phosphatidyltransferase
MVALVMCYLLVCEIPMFSFKFKSLKWNDNKARFSFLAIALAIAAATLAAGLNWSVCVLGIFCTYIVINILGNLKR